MDDIQRKLLCLTQSDLDYIEKIKQEHALPNTSAALRTIIKEHQSLSSASPADAVWDAFEKRYGSVFTRIRLGVNTADRNSQIIVKLLNSFFLENGDMIYTDDRETESIYLANARMALKKEIEHYKQLKDERETKKSYGNKEEE